MSCKSGAYSESSTSEWATSYWSRYEHPYHLGHFRLLVLPLETSTIFSRSNDGRKIQFITRSRLLLRLDSRLTIAWTQTQEKCISEITQSIAAKPYHLEGVWILRAQTRIRRLEVGRVSERRTHSFVCVQLGQWRRGWRAKLGFIPWSFYVVYWASWLCHLEQQ